MRKTSTISFFLFFNSIFFHGCIPLNKNSTSYSTITRGAVMGVKDVLLGLWSTPCGFFSSEEFRRYDLEFYQGKLFAKLFSFKDDKCEEELYSEQITFSYDLQTSEVAKIAWLKGSVTVYSSEYALKLNEDKYLGLSDWSLGKKDVTESLKATDSPLLLAGQAKDCAFQVLTSEDEQESLKICPLADSIDTSGPFFKKPEFCCQRINSEEKPFLSPYPCAELRVECSGSSSDNCSPSQFCKWDGTTCAFDTTQIAAEEVNTCPE